MPQSERLVGKLAVIVPGRQHQQQRQHGNHPTGHLPPFEWVPGSFGSYFSCCSTIGHPANPLKMKMSRLGLAEHG